MIRTEIQWIADDAEDPTNFTLYEKNGCDEFRHVRSGLLVRSGGNLERPSRLPWLFRAEVLHVSDEERELLKKVHVRLYGIHRAAIEQAKLAESSAVLRKKLAMSEKDYRLVEDKTINEP
jgi:hypothetical protein